MRGSARRAGAARANPDDGRSTLLTLTQTGRAIFDRGRPAFLRALAKLDAGLEGELDEYEQVVWAVRVALRRLATARAPAPVD